ncbi:hypothetical protein V9K92_01115 [Phyllobacterium sp. CCNWLW109]|uniref:hypothetical protein n=1 Tax=Phyllobacterium sp. CCNWLW109 TaxID=3127479 RepID=UPI003077E1F1
MDDEYELVGCVDFETTTYAISVPVLQKRNSNYSFIPKTDGHFIVLDFYVLEESGYKIRYLHSKLKRHVRIGSKTPVPIIDGDNTFILDPEIPEQEIRIENPLLGEAPLKAFISLRQRMADAAINRTSAFNPFTTEISEPVRSRYWVSKFAALLTSVHQDGDPDAIISSTADEIRKQWFERFASKATFQMVDGLLNTPFRPLPHDEQIQILLNRFDAIFQLKGLYISGQDLAGYEKRFPEGIISKTKQMEDGPAYRAWRMDDQYSNIIRSQLTRRWHAENSHQNGDALAVWPKQDVMRTFRVIRVVAADEAYLNSAIQPLVEMVDMAADKLNDIAGCIDDLSMMRLNGRSQLLKALENIFGAGVINAFTSSWDEDKYNNIIDRVLDYYDKALILTQATSPDLRKIETAEIGVNGVNPAVFETIRHDRRKLAIGEQYSPWTSRFLRLLRE